jgi:hypothetical protein
MAKINDASPRNAGESILCILFTNVSPGWGLAQSAVAAASGLIGVLVGSLMTARNQRIERKNARVREKLEQFYSPMVGIRSEIKAKSEFRKRLHAVTDAEWRKLTECSPLDKEVTVNQRWPQFEEALNYSVTQQREELIPLYRKMLDHFSTHMWLAETSTLKHYAAMTEFVEMWNRFLSSSLPPEVVNAIGHSEEPLYPLYEDLQETFDRLTAKLEETNHWWSWK